MRNTKFNTFSEVKVGDTIYWSSLDCEHIHSTIVTGITLILDGEHIPEFCDIKFSTNDSIEFSMCKHLTKIHNCIVFPWKSDSNIIYAGTSKEVVAKAILKEINKKIEILQNKKERFVKNYYA